MDPPPPSLLIPPTLSPSVPPPQTSAAAPPTTTTEIPHLTPAPNPSPNTAPQSVTHPSYAEMIYSAITALKEQDGSSRIAIAKYIERAYPGLPPNHPDLLTHHLKRLKNSGALVLNKKSYMIPRSDNNTITSTNMTTTSAISANPPQIQPQSLQQYVAATSSASPGPKRGRGRPPKSKPNGLPPSPSPAPVLANGQVQPVVGTDINIAVTAEPAEPVVPSTDLIHLMKKGRGRPKKVVVTEAGSVVVNKARGRPPKSGPLGLKKSPGRPRKPKSLVGAKRGPGRPPNNQLKPVTVPYAVAPTAAATTDSAAVFNLELPRPRGRPRKDAIPAAGGVVVVQGKRPGRPPKVPGVMQPKPRKSTGRPVGRPRKDPNAPWAISRISHPQAHAEQHGDLKRKLDFFQSKVRQALGVLRPHLANASISVVGAIQELEGLAAMDITVPWREEPQPQPQPQPQPPQLQAQALPLLQPQPLIQLQPQPQSQQQLLQS